MENVKVRIKEEDHSSWWKYFLVISEKLRYSYEYPRYNKIIENSELNLTS